MYQLYQTRKNIPWITPTMENVPHPNISEDFFEWENVPDFGMDYKDWNRAIITVKDLGITYFKLVNTTENYATYWYVGEIEKVLDKGYNVYVYLDVFMSYTRFILLNLNNRFPLVNRIYFNNKMFKRKPNLRKLIYYAFRLEDELIVQGDFAPNQIQKLTQSQFDTRFPWTNNKPYQQYRVKVNPVGDTQDVTSFTANLRSSDNETYSFTQNLGLYYVMLHPQDGLYHLYPINNKFLEMVPIPNRYGGLNCEFWNDYNHLQKHIGERFKSNINDNPDKLIGTAFEGIRDIQNIYSPESFKGVFKGPVFKNGSYNVLAFQTYKTPGYPYPQDVVGFYFMEFNPQKPLEFNFPMTIRIEPNLIDTYIEYLQPVYWAKREIKPITLLSFYEKNNLNNNDNDTNLITPTYLLTFMNEFVGVPKYNEFMNETDMISFGNQLPSASVQYANEIQAIKRTYDTGLSVAWMNAAMGLPAAIGKGAASATWGITSLINTGLHLARDKFQLELNRKNALATIGADYINTSTSNWFYVSSFLGLFAKDELVSDYNPNQRPNWKYLEDPLYRKLFSVEQKQQLKFLIEQFGFKLNMCVNWTDWFSLIDNNDNAYVEFNREWIANNINAIKHTNLPLQIQTTIIEQLANGIRINGGIR